MILSRSRIEVQGPTRLKCEKCKRHAATIPWRVTTDEWAPEGGRVDWWCSCCAAAAQLRYAQALAKRIPALQRELVDERLPCASRRGARIAVADRAILLG